MEEFFELFKTPWEFFIPGHNYDLVLSTVEEVPEALSARALVVYLSRPATLDEQLGVMAEPAGCGDWVEWDGKEFPLYGTATALLSANRAFLRGRATGRVVGCLAHSNRPTARIGYDLFHEVSFLLSQGQPPENARTPTLDLHIALLRAVMAGFGISFIEVPPAPAGYDFMACLTHDVDFVGIRDHKCDHTMWGFLYRSLIGSLVQAVRGKQPWSRCFRNWAAAWSLPLVHLGLREDFWLEFDRYLEIEKEFGSTFFFIPFKNLAGTLAGGAPAPQRRAAKYDFAAIREEVGALLKNGCEVGLHGIDAWQNPENGRTELQRIRNVTGQLETGTRMHWLYWNEASPKALEEAGCSYDSTFGYNEAVGFRAGTTQPFRPCGVERLLELPLNIQDSALFYSDRMSLPEEDALIACKEVIRSLLGFGGALTINWHTRSLSPERLWGEFYARLLSEIQTHRVWFGTAQEVVEWFRKRRAIRFEQAVWVTGGAPIMMRNSSALRAPSFQVRVHHATTSDQGKGLLPESGYTDYGWSGEEPWEIPLEEPDRAM